MKHEQRCLADSTLACLFVQGLGKLVDTGGYLQSLVEDPLLTLKTDVLGPAHIASEVPLWLNSTTYNTFQLIPTTHIHKARTHTHLCQSSSVSSL